MLANNSGISSFKNIPYKGYDLDLSEMASSIVTGNYSDIVEIFRLEGRQDPIISSNKIRQYMLYYDLSFVNEWQNINDISMDDFYSIPIFWNFNKDILEQSMRKISILRKNTEAHDFIEYDLEKILSKNIFSISAIKSSILEMILMNKSPVPIMHYCCLSACVFLAKPIYTFHITYKHNMPNGWLTTYFPFRENQNEVQPSIFLKVQERVIL